MRLQPVMSATGSGLRNLALDDFGENRASDDNSTNVNAPVNQVRLDMTPREAMEAYMSMLQSPD